jgi:hypothetical protein
MSRGRRSFWRSVAVEFGGKQGPVFIGPIGLGHQDFDVFDDTSRVVFGFMIAGVR